LGLGQWWGSEVQLGKHLLEDRLQLTLGGEYRDDFDQEKHNYFPGQPPGTGEIKLHRSTSNYGVYFQEDFQVIRTNLHFNAGVRYDQYGDFQPKTNPRLALIYHPFAKDADKTTFKAIYGTAFRTPNFYEISLNPSLEPETITTYELVYEQRLGSYLRASISGFYNEIDKLIEQQDDGSYVNKRGATAVGAEAALEASWESGVRLRASYTYEEARDRETHAILTDSPRHMGKVNLSVPLIGEKLSAGIEAQFTSTRRTSLSVFNPDPASSGIITVRGSDAAGYGVINITLLSRNLLKNLEISLSVYNLLDHRYFDPATPSHLQEDLIEQDGRIIRGKLTYRF
jgi:iron complex outermembrane receptor protein